MENFPPTVDELPHSVHWFAPWTWKRRWRWLMFGLLMLSYPLSIGPAGGLVRRGWMSIEVFGIVYRPVLMLTRASREFSDWTAWYMNQFEFNGF